MQAGRGYLPREVFFGRFGFVGDFFPVWVSDFERFFPATCSSLVVSAPCRTLARLGSSATTE
jgi:hypothetical protein